MVLGNRYGVGVVGVCGRVVIVVVFRFGLFVCRFGLF